MDELEYFEQDVQTRAWLKDLDNFGRPPPPRPLAGADAQQTTMQNGDDERVEQKIGQFQNSLDHPYATRRRVQTTKEIAQRGSAPMAMLVKQSPPTLRQSNKSSVDQHQLRSPPSSSVALSPPISTDTGPPLSVNRVIIDTSPSGAADSNGRQKELIPKAEVQNLTEEVRRSTRPKNPWADSRKVQRQVPISCIDLTTGAPISPENSSSAYSSYSSVGGNGGEMVQQHRSSNVVSGTTPTTPTTPVFSAMNAVRSPHNGEPPSVSTVLERAEQSLRDSAQDLRSLGLVVQSQSPTPIPSRDGGFGASGAPFSPQSTRSTPARYVYPPTNRITTEVTHDGRGQQHVVRQAEQRRASYTNGPPQAPMTATTTTKTFASAFSPVPTATAPPPAATAVWQHASPAQVEPDLGLDSAYRNFEETLRNSLSTPSPQQQPSPSASLPQQQQRGRRLYAPAAAATKSSTVAGGRRPLSHDLIVDRIPPSSSSPVYDGRKTQSRSVERTSSGGDGGSAMPPWRGSATAKRSAGSNSSLEAMESQQRMYERLQTQVEQQLRQNQPVYGVCFACKQAITDAADATQAMGHLYHSHCFICCSCGRELKGKRFYEVMDRVYCEEDYMYSGFQQSAERCAVCNHLIMEMVLQAVGRSFHPQCFRCTACKECLDGIPFALDDKGKVFCVKDYHRLFAPQCHKCHQPIMPATAMDETVRVVAMNKDYHIDCYVCEGCQQQLTDEPTRRCYPLGDHLLCQQCHLHWTRTGGASQPITDL